MLHCHMHGTTASAEALISAAAVTVASECQAAALRSLLRAPEVGASGVQECCTSATAAAAAEATPCATTQGPVQSATYWADCVCDLLCIMLLDQCITAVHTSTCGEPAWVTAGRSATQLSSRADTCHSIALSVCSMIKQPRCSRCSSDWHLIWVSSHSEVHTVQLHTAHMLCQRFLLHARVHTRMSQLPMCVQQAKQQHGGWTIETRPAAGSHKWVLQGNMIAIRYCCCLPANNDLRGRHLLVQLVHGFVVNDVHSHLQAPSGMSRAWVTPQGLINR